MRTIESILKRVGEARGRDRLESVHDTKPFGDAPLYTVCVWGDQVAAGILLQNGAEINQKEEEGYTPLLHAVEHGHFELVKLLVENGAKNTRDNHGHGATEIAEILGQLKILQYLQWQGDPRVNIQNAKGKAKPYQVRQVISAIERLEIENG